MILRDNRWFSIIKNKKENENIIGYDRVQILLRVSFQRYGNRGCNYLLESITKRNYLVERESKNRILSL